MCMTVWGDVYKCDYPQMPEDIVAVGIVIFELSDKGVRNLARVLYRSNKYF